MRFLNFRALPRRDGGWRAWVELAPQAEAYAVRATEKLRPACLTAYAFRRRIATGAVGALTVWLFFHVTFGANGMIVYRAKRAEYQNLRQEIDGLQKQNDRFSKQINALKSDPNTIEKEAREVLHYTKPGEVVYVAPTPSGGPDAGNHSARR